MDTWGTMGGHEMIQARRHAGFSLLEILAVVVILGIIAALLVPRISDTSDAARQNAKQHTVKALNSAIEQFYSETGSWPLELEELVPDYLPDGVPSPPDGSLAYEIDNKLHRVLP